MINNDYCILIISDLSSPHEGQQHQNQTACTMASATAMLSLLPRRRILSGGSISRCLTTKRSHSILAAAASNNCTAVHNTNYNHDDVSACHHRYQHQRVHNIITHHPNNNALPANRWFSKYASVDHSAAYQETMESQHGVQLQLALDEGRGKDDGPFDPFSQFLDEMGTTVESFEEDDDGEVGGVDDNEGAGDIEEAEYETKEEFDDGGEDDEDEDDMEEEDEEDDDNQEGPIYTTTGALYRPKSERLALRAGYPAGGKFAVILLAGFQHKVTADDLLVVNKLKPVSQWSVGSTHTIKNDDILLMANQNQTLVGLPGVKGGEVDLTVEEITRDKTLVIFKKRRRKNSRRKNGFRRQVTFLRVLAVRMPGEEKGDVKLVGGEKGEDVVMEEDVRIAA